ncbi:MAG: response regulator [Proteobacteria bacterium]|nr:response regulator [Pseudomonadota bacterium]
MAIAHPPPRRSMTGAGLLLVEDEALVAEMLREALLDAGAEAVHAVPSVRAALDVLDHHSITAAVLDLDLEGETSAAVADALVAARIPFAFFTGASQANLPPAHRAALVVRKPAIEKLLDAVEEMCGRPGNPATRA